MRPRTSDQEKSNRKSQTEKSQTEKNQTEESQTEESGTILENVRMSELSRIQHYGKIFIKNKNRLT